MLFRMPRARNGGFARRRGAVAIGAPSLAIGRSCISARNEKAIMAVMAYRGLL